MKHKVCFKCGSDKPLTEYYKHKQMGDGHLNKCKECVKVDVNKYRKENAEKIREYDRLRANLPHRVANRVAYTKKYREMFPEKYRANSKVSNAIRDGMLTRPDKCEGCGKPCTPHAHHWSYAEENWLDVEWLCAVCHGEMHAKRS